MSVFDRDWFWVDSGTDRISKFFDSEYNKEKQMFEESWNPIFGQKLTWAGWSGERTNGQKLSDWQIYEFDRTVEPIEPSHFGSSIELKGVASQEEFDKLKEMVINLEDEVIELQGVEEQLQELKDEIEILKDNQVRLMGESTIKKETSAYCQKSYHPETEEPFVNSKEQFTRHEKNTHKAYKTLDEMFEDIEDDLDQDSNEYRTMKALKDYSLVSNHNETALLSCIKKNINALKQKMVADYLSQNKEMIIDSEEKGVINTKYATRLTKTQDANTKVNVGDKITIYSTGKEPLGTYTITGVKPSLRETDPLKDFSIGDRVIGLTPDYSIISGKIIAFDDYYLLLNKGENRYWLNPKRSLKLTPELEQEIVKLIKA